MSQTMIPGQVSVVVASYNHAGYLKRRMDSLVAQTYSNIEILVIDDCSPDHSLEVLATYESNPKVKLIKREQNGGWVAVSNQGVEISQGEFILFANCDDACDPRMIERLVDALVQKPQAGVAFCRSLMIDEYDHVLGDDYQIREKSFRDYCASDALINREQMRRFLLHSCVIPNLSAALIRRSSFETAGRLTADYRACSDWDLFFRVADDFDFCYVAQPLNFFRQHGTTIRSATKGRVTFDEFFRLLLGQIRHDQLSVCEQLYFRRHVMYLWAVDLLRPSLSGWSNFAHHARLVYQLDPLALPLLPVAMLQRVIEAPKKVCKRVFGKHKKCLN